MDLNDALRLATDHIVSFPEGCVYIVCTGRMANHNQYKVLDSLKQARLWAAPDIRHCTVVTKDNVGQIFL